MHVEYQSIHRATRILLSGHPSPGVLNQLSMGIHILATFVHRFLSSSFHILGFDI